MKTEEKFEIGRGRVGESPLHLSGRDHVTGRSQFVDDMPKPRHLLQAKLLTSPVARGHITKLDFSRALQVPGVVKVITAKDIPGENQVGGIIPDEACLSEGHVACVGEPIAIVVAENSEAARLGVKAIQLEIESETPNQTVWEAIRDGEYVSPIRKIERGEVDAAFQTAPHVIEGLAQNEGQEHFYMETQRSMAVPEDNGAITIYASTQHPTEVHRMTSGVLGLPQHMVTIDVKRLGGGFGGKESQATIWAACAGLSALLTGRPVELKLDREEDMAWTGKRHQFVSPYKAAFDDEGRILALDIELNANAGCTADATSSILERGMLHSENIYMVENHRVVGRPCRTNRPSATAFRGFGAPQGIFVIESIIERIAFELGKDPYDIRELNAYRPGDTTPYGETVENAKHIAPLFAELRKSSDWNARRKAIREFNAGHKWEKKGLAMTPVKFGISFTAAFLNQGVALIQIYPDGSVSVNHGAIEMGQEVNTKIAQIAATDLGLKLSDIRIETNNTKRVGNAPPTAASSGCDLNGHAVDNACEQLVPRLQKKACELFGVKKVLFEESVLYEVRDDGTVNREKPLSTFKDFALQCFRGRVDLCAHGHYVTPFVDFDREAGRGHPFLYYVFGAAVSEVTVDLLTGIAKVDRVDILHDSGQSLNPAVDVGQIEGAFVQGQGWCTTEELVYSDKGALVSNSPATYKIPTYGDLAPDFRVKLYESSYNDVGVHDSKANGEPPFVYGESVFFAIADAIASATGKWPETMTLPATPEKVLKALRKA